MRPPGPTDCSAWPSTSPPTESRMRSNDASAGSSTANAAAPRATSGRPRSSDDTSAVTSAPSWAASWMAKRPTPPLAPVTSTARFSTVSARSTARSAVSPATGNVAATAALTLAGRWARRLVATATCSAHAPCRVRPTTGAPVRGPEPSAAASATTPARSQPGRHPSSAVCSARTSPRLSDTASTVTTASDGAGLGAATSRSDRRPGADGSATRARMVSMGGATRAWASVIPAEDRQARKNGVMTRVGRLGRTVLGLAGAILAVGACGSDNGGSSTTTTTTVAGIDVAGIDVAAARSYCTSKGGTVQTRQATWGTNNPQAQWQSLDRSVEACRFQTLGDNDDSRIYVDLVSLYSNGPTLAS